MIVRRASLGVLPITLLLTACPKSVIPDFNAAKEACSPLKEPPSGAFEPDAVLHLSEALVSDLTRGLLQEYGALNKRVSGGTVGIEPDFRIDAVKIRKAEKCDDCLRARVELSGQLKWDFGPMKGVVPIDAVAAFDAAFEGVRQTNGDWDVLVRPKRVSHVDVTIDGVETKVKGFVEGQVRGYFEDHFLEKVPNLRVARFKAKDLPIVSLRAQPTSDGIDLLLRTAARRATKVSDPLPAKAQGWQLEISTESVVSLACHAAVTREPLPHDIVPEPTSLQLGDKDFSLGLRLWRVAGRGWWRDYVVDGTYDITKRGVSLKPSEATAAGASPGAATADPLAAIAQGFILKAIEDALTTTVPAGGAVDERGLQLDVHVQEVAPHGEALVLIGAATTKTPTRTVRPGDGDEDE